MAYHNLFPVRNYKVKSTSYASQEKAKQSIRGMWYIHVAGYDHNRSLQSVLATHDYFSGKTRTDAGMADDMGFRILLAG
jgi:hypothetical protein